MHFERRFERIFERKARIAPYIATKDERIATKVNNLQQI